MGFKCGIVGLPNVGKSTLFNALTDTQAAQAANYPFCTIEPNVGQVAVPDARLDELAGIAGSAKIIPTQLAFVDIAGLVTRRVARARAWATSSSATSAKSTRSSTSCAASKTTTSSMSRTRSIRSPTPRRSRPNCCCPTSKASKSASPPSQKKATGGDKEAKIAASVLGQALDLLREGKPARLVEPKDEEEARIFAQAQLLTAKPVLYVCNVNEDAAAAATRFGARVRKGQGRGRQRGRRLGGDRGRPRRHGDRTSGSSSSSEIGLSETGLAPGHPLGLRPAPPASPSSPSAPRKRAPGRSKRARKAPQAAGEIHSDFERGFIRAETIAYDDYVTLGGESAARDAGKLRQEGKEYVVKDGDVLHFKFNV